MGLLQLNHQDHFSLAYTKVQFKIWTYINPQNTFGLIRCHEYTKAHTEHMRNILFKTYYLEKSY